MPAKGPGPWWRRRCSSSTRCRTRHGEIDLPVAIDDADVTEAWLSSRAQRRVALLVPQRGDRKRLVDLASRNAELAVRAASDPGGESFAALDGLRQALALPALPRRIECIDVSTLQGSETVAAVVVCEDGRMVKGEYRKYRVSGPGARGSTVGARRPKTGFRAETATNSEVEAVAGTLHGDDGRPTYSVVREPDPAPVTPSPGTRAPALEPRFLNDFAAMAHVVQRRFARVVEAGGPFPDLLVIDGGRGQLDAAYAALERLGLANLVAVGLAKREELVVTRDSEVPVAFDRSSPALRLLQQIRDEAHRFAVTFHRQARSQRDFRSDLDAIPGVGPRRRRALLIRFGSLAGVRRATREDLVPVVGQRCADAVLTHFARGAPSN